MRIPRMRFTVRRGMVLVALAALGLFLWEEFRDGWPPRAVIRGMPARMARLRPGMDEKEVAEILGLERSWLLGGTGARFYMGPRSGMTRYDTYLIRPWRSETIPAGGSPSSPRILSSPAVIHLDYDIEDAKAGPVEAGTRRPKTARLARATFKDGSTTIAEMPR